MIKILYKHWKTGVVLEVTGTVRFDNPQSDRIIVEQEDGTFEDIIRSTIISMKNL